MKPAQSPEANAMEEREWNICDDPEEMLEFLWNSGTANDRKLRLFALAVCRRIWPMMLDARSQRAVEVAEEFLDGLAQQDGLRAAWEEAHAPAYSKGGPAAASVEALAARLAYLVAAPLPLGSGTTLLSRDAAISTARAVAAYSVDWFGTTFDGTILAGLLREIFGPLPFRFVPVEPYLLNWYDSAIPRLAQAIYDERAWDLMPELADQLEAAGRDNREILEHCRRQGAVHVRGCWVVDLLLQKS